MRKIRPSSPIRSKIAKVVQRDKRKTTTSFLGR